MNDNQSSLILMSTYNGEKYLAQQIDSIIDQTNHDWVLVIRDDGSTDKTKEILKRYTSKYEHIIHLEDQAGNVGVIRSYSILMEYACKRNEPYIFFSDQDDVWLPHKISTTIKRLAMEEKKHSANTPILVHSDLEVVNQDLKTIHASFKKLENFKRQNYKNPLKTLIVNNYITGCTIGMNRSLLEIATPIPDNARMHDWWCGLCAAANGVVKSISQPTILYRQHDNNVIGSKGFFNKFKTPKSIYSLLSLQPNKLRASIQQASAVAERVKNEKVKQEILDFAELPQRNIFQRYCMLYKFRLRPVNKIRLIMLWSFLGLI